MMLAAPELFPNVHVYVRNDSETAGRRDQQTAVLGIRRRDNLDVWSSPKGRSIRRRTRCLGLLHVECGRRPPRLRSRADPDRTTPQGRDRRQHRSQASTRGARSRGLEHHGLVRRSSGPVLRRRSAVRKLVRATSSASAALRARADLEWSAAASSARRSCAPVVADVERDRCEFRRGRRPPVRE